ncbi:acyl-CoA carboxylase subunit epsilon [Streptomyces sp. NPDC047000]|uniref:acyl-CoA carboxylase subunit epsilon n=1 Tax=Streptomyces sp. NPDC047000 TaxID=3155474 RepID=UPI0033CD7591
MSAGNDDEGVLLRVLRGAPTPEELAAATAVLLELVRRVPEDGGAAPARRTATWHRPALTTHRAATSWRG